MNYFLELEHLNVLLWLFVAIIFVPPISLIIIGFSKLKSNKKAAKTLFVLAAIYQILSVGLFLGMIYFKK